MDESSSEQRDNIPYRQFTTRGLPQWQLGIISKYPSIYLEASPKVLSLYEDYPENLDLENYCNLRSGFECGPGWAKLIDDFSARAVALVTALHSFGWQSDACISSFIFKEKFGTLDWQGHDNLIEPFKTFFFAYTLHIQAKSGSICERTGAFGQRRDLRGRIITLCDEEYEKERKRLSLPRSR